MRLLRGLLLLVAIALGLLSCTVTRGDAVPQHKYALLQQLVTNVSRYALPAPLHHQLILHPFRILHS